MSGREVEANVWLEEKGSCILSSCPSNSDWFGCKTCSWTGRIEELPGHVEGCQHAMVPCPGSCGKRLPRKAMAMHVQTCSKCPERLVPCPNGCTRQSKPFVLPFSSIEEHRMTCPKEPIPCSFDGCSAIVPRYQLPYHEKV